MQTRWVCHLVAGLVDARRIRPLNRNYATEALNSEVRRGTFSAPILPTQ